MVTGVITKLIKYADAVSGLFDSASSTVIIDGITRSTKQVKSIAELRTTVGRYNGDLSDVVSFHADWAPSAVPKGGGRFVWISTMTSTVVTGIIEAVTGVATGRWVRLVPNNELFGEMCGARGDKTTDDTTALQTMLTHATDTGRNANLDVGEYLITASLVLRTFPITMAGTYPFHGLPDFKGRNANQSRLIYPGITSAPALIVENIVGQRYSPLKAEVGSRMTFEGSLTSWGIEYRGVGQINTSNTIFSTNRWGQVYHNKDAGQYTEFVMSRDCRYTRYCISKWRMMKTAGDDSMHGNAWENCTWEQDPGQPAFTIENNCIWYNGKIDGTYFSNGETTILLNNNGNVRYVADCYLNLTYEASTNARAILCDAPSINRGLYFVGTIRTLQKPVILKKAYRVKSLDRDPFSATTNNPSFESRSFLIKPTVDGQMDMTDLVADIVRWGGCLMQVMYSSVGNQNTHFYSDVVFIGPSGNYNPEAVAPVLAARLIARNTNGHNPATYSYIGTTYGVRMTNANFTIANGSFASVTLIPLGNLWSNTPDNNLVNG